MKTIILSFDDARRDFYTRALPIIKKYNLTATLNVISDFILNPSNYCCFSSGNNEAITSEELKLCQDMGIEIACHGHSHLNTKSDILQNITILKTMGLTFEKGIGFASPNSELTDDNKCENGVWELVTKGILSYCRSGIQIRREGLLYTFITLLDYLVHSPRLWYWLNSRNVIDKRMNVLPSATIHSYTTLQQIQYMINRMPDNTALILMFHSICTPNDIGFSKDKWYWSSIRFEKLCQWLAQSENISCVTTIEYVNKPYNY